MAEWAREATGHGADLVCFPELAITGYPPEDLVLRRGVRGRQPGGPGGAGTARLRRMRGAGRVRRPNRSRAAQRGRRCSRGPGRGAVPQAQASQLRGVRRAAVLRAGRGGMHVPPARLVAGDLRLRGRLEARAAVRRVRGPGAGDPEHQRVAVPPGQGAGARGDLRRPGPGDRRLDRLRQHASGARTSWSSTADRSSCRPTASWRGTPPPSRRTCSSWTSPARRPRRGSSAPEPEREPWPEGAEEVYRAVVPRPRRLRDGRTGSGRWSWACRGGSTPRSPRRSPPTRSGPRRVRVLAMPSPYSSPESLEDARGRRPAARDPAGPDRHRRRVRRVPRRPQEVFAGTEPGWPRRTSRPGSGGTC